MSATTRRSLLAALALLVGLAHPPAAAAGERFVVRAARETVEALCRDNGLKCVRKLGRPDLYLVEAPHGATSQALQAFARNPQIVDVELEEKAQTPEAPQASLQQSTKAFLEGLDRNPIDFYGGSVWTSFVYQPATELTGVHWAHRSGFTGQGVVVAVIDTGVDQDHPALLGALVPGYDFVRDVGGGSEWSDSVLQQSTKGFLERSASLQQSTKGFLERSALLEQSTKAFLEQSTKAFLEQSTKGFLEQSTKGFLESETGAPDAFGHGTMVAGLIRLVAPDARIMPLKVFTADGSGNVSDIVRAIYWAVERGAKVINMSFSLQRASREISRAIQYASARGVICVASAGNQGKETMLYPASLNRVFGVAATTLEDARAPFSNYGENLVEVAAPGVDLLTVYPGGNYALVSGTSFSAAWVSGAAAVFAGIDGGTRYQDAAQAFQRSVFISEELGWGRIDIPEAIGALPSSGRRQRR